MVVYDLQYGAILQSGHLLGEYNGTGGLVQETIWLGDIPVATLRPGTPVAINYVHTNHLNTPVAVTRPSDNKLRWQWHPDAFGVGAPNENPQALGAFKYNLRFPGQYYDQETGQYYNYFRDYDPLTGRYVESDPIGLTGGVNSYTYVENNSFTYSDPLGLVKRGPGWSGPQWTKIKSAEGTIRQELSKCSCSGGGSGCIPCELRAGLLTALSGSAVSEAPLGGDCGVGAIPGAQIYLSPAAFTKKCDCLTSTLYHELLHNTGLEHDASANGPGVNDLEKRCMGSLCKK